MQYIGIFCAQTLGGREGKRERERDGETERERKSHGSPALKWVRAYMRACACAPACPLRAHTHTHCTSIVSGLKGEYAAS